MRCVVQLQKYYNMVENSGDNCGISRLHMSVDFFLKRDSRADFFSSEKDNWYVKFKDLGFIIYPYVYSTLNFTKFYILLQQFIKLHCFLKCIKYF